MLRAILIASIAAAPALAGPLAQVAGKPSAAVKALPVTKAATGPSRQAPQADPHALPPPSVWCPPLKGVLVGATEVQFLCATDTNPGLPHGLQPQRYSFARQGNDVWIDMVRNAARAKQLLGLHLVDGKIVGVTEM